MLFEVEVQDVAKTLAVASALAALPDELAGALHDSQDDDEHDDNLLLEWYEPVKRATNELGQLANPLQHFTQHYDAAVLVSLRHISRDFRRRGRDVSDAELNALRDALQNLATALAEEGIPEDLRRFMLVRLAEMADALRLFKLQGAAALRKAVDASVGATVTRQYEGKAVRPRDEGRPLLLRHDQRGGHAGLSRQQRRPERYEDDPGVGPEPPSFAAPSAASP